MKKLYCYSHQEFNLMMEKLGWENRPENGYSTISICSKNDEDPNHWFNVEDISNNINIDCDDVSPEMWWDKDYYDEALDNYNNGISDDYFNCEYFINSEVNLHAMDYNDAKRLVEFIDDRIRNYGDNIFVHCAAGTSRSQAIVRYILDTYPDIEWKTRDSNPCITPNIHIVRMLKRMYRNLYY